MNIKIINETDFKVKQLTQWGFKSSQWKLDEDRVDIKIPNIWVETKQKYEDIYDMLAQIIFTAYKVKGYRELPIYFACFNSEKGAIIENHQAQDIFRHTDIDWTQTPSKLDKKTIERIKFLIKEAKEYNLDDLGKKFKEIAERGSLRKRHIDKNNFLSIYQEWLNAIGNDINPVYFGSDEIALSDCYLADLMTDGKKSIADKLKVILDINSHGNVYKKIVSRELYSDIKIENQKSYLNFWSKYERPPAEEYQDYILNRRDLLQADNIREIKGAFFTPKIWCDVSKEYFAKTLGENWQDEYYIWDCCCGTGNLERGLVNQERVYMSTLDQADIDIMKQLNTMPDSIKFQMDFLNDEWKPVAEGGKIKDSLWKIIKNEPEKLVIYINPPYLEVTNAREIIGTGGARSGSTSTGIVESMVEYGMGRASRELFVQFFYRMYKEIPNCKIGAFSKLKHCNAPSFKKFRDYFNAKFLGGFVCRADTFDNVRGQFPISFQIWDCEVKEDFPKELKFDVWEMEKLQRGMDKEDAKAEMVGVKVSVNPDSALINEWFQTNNRSTEEVLCYTTKQGNDFQHQNTVALYGKKPQGDGTYIVTQSNLVQALIYVAVRLCIPATWLNDRDQFTAPRKITKTVNIIQEEVSYEYESDQNFINNCVVFALFEKNNTNWQIFPNSQIGINGVERDMKIYNMLLKNKKFSAEAEAVLEITREIYKLYNLEFSNPHASWYEVCKSLRESRNIKYDELRKEFLKAQVVLALEIASDVYKYGFLS
jgi:hypothetical protein